MIMNSNQVKLDSQLAQLEDLEAIAYLHMKAFPNFFLTAMGLSFVREYYRAVLEFPDSIAMVIQRENKLLGFIVGFGNPEAFYDFYRKRRLRLVGLTFWAIIRKPYLIKRILLNFRRVSDIKTPESDIELSSLAVTPDEQGRGIGTKLIQSFLQIATERKYQNVYLTTDSQSNDSVNYFYSKLGFILEESFLSGSRQMNRYRKTLKITN
jgi:ribosomal protein S18 acetylase RimI-like enzyme